jgi:SpoVK/Ycf46/Vps4 family AAA+-type ATPase
LFEEDLNTIQAEAYEHLWNGRFRLALTAAEKVYQARPDDSEAAICLAWALLENGNPMKAMDYANLAVELKGDSIKARVYRGYLLYRMSIFEGAVADIDLSLTKQKEILAWTYLNKSKSLAGLQKFEDAFKALDLAIITDDGKNTLWEEMRDWLAEAQKLINDTEKIDSGSVGSILEKANQAIKAKEYWFSLLAARKILENIKSSEAEIIELESMLYLFQLKPALKKAEIMSGKFKNSEKFKNIYNALKKYSQLEQDNDVRTETGQKRRTKRKTFDLSKTIISNSENKLHSNALFYPNEFADIFSIKMFDIEREAITNDRDYCKIFDPAVRKIGADIILNNPFYNQQDKTYNCTAVWYLNDFELFRNNFQLNLKKDLDSIIFVQTCGSEQKYVWKIGQARIEIYINNFKVGEKNFGIGQATIYEPTDKPTQIPKTKQTVTQDNSPTQIQHTRTTKSLEELIAELDSFTGLSSIKEAVKSFISYLEFLKERKRLGLKSEDKISINSVFLGNPGTGKTTIARMLGDIFYSLGILSNGHVVEVDRSRLVGQYIGETAQKTEKIINEAIGGLLFIDEAYTLVKKGGSQDFGQEAIDILLKRMEDRKGEFVVIVAGYPDEMNSFLTSNPGLKSRFSHTFIFEDYTPDEMQLIFKQLIEKEEYKLTADSEAVLLKEFISLYRIRDKSFGNARLVRNIFEEAKLNLSKACLELPENLRTKEAITTFTADILKAVFAKSTVKEVKIPINEEALAEALSDLQNLVGLKNLKKEIIDMVKLARYLNEQGEDIKKIFNEHILFLGNPGTGKTTVARIFGRIYSALGILKKGHLIETDRQGLVAGYVGQTAEKTTGLVDKSLGGMLFIDEAYALIKKNDIGSDFGKEAIDILLKRMEDDRGKFIVIAAGYTDEMHGFVASNPGIQSRFSKSFTFEDYTPDELGEIVKRSLEREKKSITKEAEERLQKHFEELYKNRDKKFGNARIVRNILENVKQKMLLRLSDIPLEERTEEKAHVVELSDINEVLNREIEAKQFQVKGDPLNLQEYINELNMLINLDKVKLDLFKLINFSKISQLKKERGLQAFNRNLNSIYIGNPGTGKSTVAKLICKIYKELGILSNGHLFEVERTDLVAGYQGQTAANTEKIIQQALGGILYIKDAPSLFNDDNLFAREAIETILKRLQDYNGKFVLILSGKPLEMNLVLKKNTGLTAYFPNIFEFEDYSPRQLLGIAVSLAEKNGYTFDEGALQEILDIFSRLSNLPDYDKRNGVLAKHILYSAITNQEERIFNIYEQSDVDLTTLILEDIQKIKI